MMKKKAKLEMETLGKILLLTAFLIIVLLLFKGCRDQAQHVGVVGVNEYTCWLSHTTKAQLSSIIPSLCNPIDVVEPQDSEGIALLMRKCWWMFGQGEGDVNWRWEDDAHTCYLFTPKEDIYITDLEEHLRKYGRKGEVSEEDSTWTYIHKEGDVKTRICFDKKFEEKEDGKLQKGKRYFIMYYYENVAWLSKEKKGNDGILISRDPEFGKGQTGPLAYFLQFFKEYCSTPESRLEIKGEEENAIKLFDTLVKNIKTCFEKIKDKDCVCDDSDVNIESNLPRDYHIEISNTGEKQYSILLYHFAELIKSEDIKNIRLGLLESSKRYNCEFGLIEKPQPLRLEKPRYELLYSPNNHKILYEKNCLKEGETYPVLYFTSSRLSQEKCSEISAEGEKEKTEEEQEKTEAEQGLEIFLGKGTTIPESIVLDKNRIGEEDKIYIAYEYDCGSVDAMKSCMDVKEHNLIKAELKLKSEPEPGFLGRITNFFKTPLYTYQINQEQTKEIAKGKTFSRGYVDIIINTDQLKENEEYTLTINAYDESDKRTTYETVLTKTFKFNFVPLESECKTLAKGKEEKFKLYFIGDQYLSLGNFEADLSNIVDYEGKEYGIFSIEPFKSHREKFTIYYNSYTQGTAEDLVRKCPQSILLFLVDKPFRSYVSYVEDHLGGLGAGVAYISTIKESIMPLQKTSVHEFGHAFADLADEYEDEKEGNYPKQPNCAPDKETAKEWWDDLEGTGAGNLKIGYFDGCAYIEKNIRPVQNSVMRHQDEVSSAEWKHGFGPVNERCLLKILTEEGTCEEPEDLDEMRKYTKQVKEAYSKI